MSSKALSTSRVNNLSNFWLCPYAWQAIEEGNTLWEDSEEKGKRQLGPQGGKGTWNPITKEWIIEPQDAAALERCQKSTVWFKGFRVSARVWFVLGISLGSDVLNLHRLEDITRHLRVGL